MANQSQHVGRGRAAGIDDEARVLAGDFGPADTEAFEAGFFNHGAHKMTCGTAEGAAGARHFQRLFGSPAMAEILHFPLDGIPIPGAQFRCDVEHDGVLFLQEAKGFSDVEAISVVSISYLLRILGTVLSGWFSDKLFKGDRKVPALIFGVLNAAALALFFYGGNAMWVNVLSMVLFGIAIGVLICFLGGLMAVDIVPRKATGAALGVVGMTSYIAAGIQDVASGWLIDSNITVAADGVKHYDFGPVAIFWLAAAVISFLLPLLNRGKVKEF